MFLFRVRSSTGDVLKCQNVRTFCVLPYVRWLKLEICLKSLFTHFECVWAKAVQVFFVKPCASLVRVELDLNNIHQIKYWKYVLILKPIWYILHNLRRMGVRDGEIFGRVSLDNTRSPVSFFVQKRYFWRNVKQMALKLGNSISNTVLHHLNFGFFCHEGILFHLFPNWFCNWHWSYDMPYSLFHSRSFENWSPLSKNFM